MADMLVKLYTLPPLQPALDRITAGSIEIRPARPGEEHVIEPWITHYFSAGWSQCVRFGIYRNPCALFLAIQKQQPDPMRENRYKLPPEQLIGFSCYDASGKGMFGPIGVMPDYEGRGIGSALLLTALHAMSTESYAYAIIGWAGPVEWYQQCVGAVVIPDSEPGPFRGGLRGL